MTSSGFAAGSLASGLGGVDGLPAELGASFDHVAIAGRRIRDMLPLWQDTLGGRFVIGADNAAAGWRAVRLELGGIWCVELIEPLAGSAFLDGFFRRHPSGWWCQRSSLVTLGSPLRIKIRSIMITKDLVRLEVLNPSRSWES